MNTQAFEWWLVRTLGGRARAMDWRASLALGERLGDVARRLGLRRAVAEDNLRRAEPSRPEDERRRILAEHYRELGRIALEYSRLPELTHSDTGGEFIAEVRGFEHMLAARERGRGAIVMTGHFGNFELLGAWAGRHHALDFVARPLSNPDVERWVTELRRRAGVGVLSADRQVREIYAALRANRWVGMLADQDARRHGVFVPFLGRPASTPVGPARIALATGAAMLTGVIVRGPDGRHRLEFEPAIEHPQGPTDQAALELTRRHTERLEARVLQHPWNWFWLHRRWKTAPASG